MRYNIGHTCTQAEGQRDKAVSHYKILRYANESEQWTWLFPGNPRFNFIHIPEQQQQCNARCLQLLLVVCFLYLAFVQFHFWPNHLVAIITVRARTHRHTFINIRGEPEQRINKRKVKKTENILLYNRVVRSTSNFFHVTYIVESMLMRNICEAYRVCVREKLMERFEKCFTKLQNLIRKNK